MGRYSALLILIMLGVIFGCNNPKGGSSIARDHTPLLQPPGPFSFNLIRASSGNVKITWQSSQRAENYTFFMGTDPSDISTTVSACSNSNEACELTGLNPTTLYYFTVRATNAAGSQMVSSVGRALSVGSFDITSSVPSDKTVTFTWGNSAGATGYNIIYGTVPGSYPNTVTNITSPYTLSGLSNGVTYYARIVAVNSDNGYALNTTEANGQPFGPLTAPQNLSAVATPNQISLEWDNLPGATNYKVYRGTSAGALSEIANTIVPSAYVDTHNNDGTPYFYAVRAFNGFDGAMSSVVSAQSISAFTMSSAVAGPMPGQATVAWSTPVTGASSFDIAYGSNPASLNLLVSNVTSPYVFSGLTGGLTYYFRVVGKNATGGGTTQNSTNQLSAIPVAPILPPTGLAATATPAVTNLSWNTVPGSSEYRVYRSTTAGGPYALAGSPTGTTFGDTTATPDGSTYFYVVRSFNGLESVNSSEVSVRPINSFSLSSATVATFSSADLTWAAATGATGYDILYGTASGNYTQTSLNRTSPATLTGLTAATTYYVVIRAKNAVGSGTNLLSNERTFTTGTLFPTVTLDTHPLINNANKNSYTVSGTCTENGRAVTLNAGTPNSATCTALAWSLTTDISAAADSATFSLVATHTNSGGNTDTDTKTIVKDTTNPTVAITTYPSIRAANEAAYTVSGTCSENGRTVAVNIGGINATPACTALAWSATVDASGLSDNPSISITADLTDAAGNAGTQATRNVIKDTVPPAVAISSSPVINNANKAAYTVSGTCSETGENVVAKVGSVTATVACTLLNWTATLNVTSVADAGGVVVTADHSDAAGNPATQATALVLKDSVNPVVTITAPATIISSNDNAYPISGTCSENSRNVVVNVGGVTATVTCSAAAWNAILDVSALSDNPSIAVSATHTDSALNQTVANATVVKTTALPTVTIASSPSINNTNKAAYTVSGTCSHNGRAVSVNVGGVTASPTCTTLAWSATLNVTAVTDNANVSVTADHVDAVGNAAIQASANVIKDTVIPTVSITSPAVINNANKASYTVSGACSENTRTVNVSVGGVTGTPVCSALAWTTTLDVSGVTDSASVSVTANHTDAVGNAATQATATITKDTSNPTVTIASSPAINNANKAAYVVSGACSENTRAVTVSVGGISATPTCTALAWTASLNVTALSDSGSVSVTANHSDASGNSAAQASATVVKDTSLPTVAISVTPVINNSNKNSYTFSGTCSETGQAVSVAVGSTTGSVTCTLLTWSATLNVSGNADSGTLLITADHSDAVGNSAVQAGTTVVKDTANPTVALNALTAITNANKAAYPVSGTCSENTRTVSVNVGGVTGSPTCTALAWSTTLDVTLVADNASVSVTANHSDSAGNNATQASTTVVKQTALPTVSITAPAVINNANKAAYSVSGSCSENTRTVTVSVGGVTGTPTCTALAWTTTLNVTAVADNGAVSITANHSDSVGNNAVQATASVVKDTVIPTVAITTPAIINNANKAAYTVSGTCSENGRTVSVSVGGVSSSPTCSSLAWSATVNVTAVADNASLSITANHSDAAGNNPTQASASVVKDTSNPTVAITSPSVINNANKAVYTVSGSCSENTRTVSVSVGGVTASPVCSALAWTTTLNVTAVADNASVAITADHSDANGNSATQATASVVKDTGLPTVAITSSTIINNANKASYIVTGTCSENSRSVSVSVGGVSGTPTCSTGTWSSTLNVTSVGDGASVAITADHSDASGNSAAQATASVLKDTVNPTVAITSSPNIISANATAYPVSGTCSENTRTVSVSVGGVTATPTCSSATWSATMNVSGLSDAASITVTANHSDAAGNNATQASATIEKATNLPTVSITTPVAINNTNKASYPLSGTCSVNTRTVSVSVGGVSASPTCTTNAWSANVNVSALTDTASVSVTADHSDALGNNAIQATTSVLKDTVVPTVTITTHPVINNANKATYSFGGACSENGRTVTVSAGGVSGSATCTTLAWSATVNVSSIGDGASVSLTADHADLAGNSAAQASTTVVKDTSNPTVGISGTLAINNTNKSSYPVTGSCSENGRTVSVTVGGIAGSATCTTLAWSTNIDVSSLADSGTVSITANHSDASGNAATQASVSVVKDTGIPTVAITSNPAINNTNKASYTVGGTCSENGRQVSVSVGGITGTPNCSGGNWSTTLNVNTVSDSATVSITANHSDASGNAATQASVTVVKDTVIPTVSITTPVAINNTNKAVYPISGTCSENTRTVSVVVGGRSGSATCTALAWSTTIDVTLVGDGGSIAITADHTDAVNNSAAQATASTSKDTTAPTVAITAPAAINNSNKASYTVSGSCSENTRSVSVSVGGVAATPTCTTLAWSATVDVSGLSDTASVSVTANHSDAAGNNATQATASALKDTVIPTVTISSAPAINNTNKGTYVVSGTCSENTRAVTVSVGGITSTPTCTTLAWSATLNVSSLSDGGSVAVTANHTDLAGNTATQASATTTKDTAVPLVSITAATAINNTNKASYTVTGTCSENGQSVTVSVGGVGSTPTCTTGAWSATVNVTAVADGSVSITANHSDTSGNAATQASTSATKDTTNPLVAITAPVAINNSNKGAYPVGGTCSENGRSVSVSVGGVSATPSCSGGAWSTTVNVTAVTDSASVAVTADHTDLAGNSATQAATTTLKDVIVPTVSITSSPVINNTNKASYTVSGLCSENSRNVSVTVGSVSGTPACTTGAWSVTLNVTAVSDGGSVIITANHTDLAGNAATQASTTVTKDTGVPTVAITTPGAINNTNKAAYSLGGSCSENGRTVSVSVGGVSASPSCSGGTWSATVNASGVSDGASIAVTADHSDVNGNSATQATATALKDTVIPTVSFSTTPNINNTNKGAYTLSGLCSENGRPVSVSVGGITATPNCSSLAWTATLNVTALADSASVSVTANHSDLAGNSATQAATTVAKDTGIPGVAISSPAVINNANKTSYSVSGTCTETGQSVSVMVGSVSASDTCTLLTWSVTVNVIGVPDSGSVLITADHSDAAGNSAVQAGTTVVKDTVIPTVAITTPALINTANRAAYTVSGSCSENTRTVSLNVGGVTASPTCSGGAWTSTLNVTSVADSGSVSITANHTDSAGNSATQASTTVVKDATNPTVAITNAPSINIANVTSYTFSGTCSENGRTVTLSSGGNSVPATCTAGAWTVTANVSSFADSASMPLNAAHTDAAGNSATDARTILKDTVAPTVTLSTAASEPTTAASWTVRATFSETVTGVAIGDFVMGNSSSSGFTIVSGVAYDITQTPSSEGVTTVNMAAGAATDVAGNPSTVALQLSRTYQNPAVLTFADASTYDFGSISTGGFADVTMVINKTGSPSATSVTEISLAAPFAFAGGAFPGTGGTCTTTISGNCSIVVRFTPTAAGVRNGIVQLQYNNGTSTVSASRSITGTGVVLTPTNIAVSGPTGIMINQCIPYVLTSETAAGLQANVTSNVTVNLVVNNGTGTFYSNSGCSTTATSTTISNGTSTRTIYFRSTTANQNLTLVFNPTTVLTPTTAYVETSSAPTKISVNPPAEMQTNICVPVVVDLVDNNGNKAGRNVAVQVNLTKTGNAIFYSDNICTGVITSTSFPAFTETKTVFVRNTSAQTVTLTFTDNAGTLTADSASVIFTGTLTWWNNAYYKRIPITLDNLDQPATHTNIPILVRLNPSRISYADTKAGGADIRFTLSDHTTALSYEIESWNTSGESLVWVKIPSITASTQRIIYMYYSNPAATDGQSATNTWTGYQGVWNMKKSGANYVDSSGTGKTGVPVGTVTDTAGPTGNSIRVNGSSSIDTNYDLSQILGKTSTLSFWIRSTQAGSNTVWQSPGITGVEESGGGNDIFFGHIMGNGSIAITAGNGASSTSGFAVNDNNWRLVTMSRNETSGAVRFYTNGVLNGSGTSETGAKTTTFDSFGFVRNTGGASNFFNGFIDGIRMSNTILTDDRIRAEYKFSIETNIVYGTPEDL